MVRDVVLSISGLLNRDVGGPSVFPPAPEFLFLPPVSYGTKEWKSATDNNQYRRSLYVQGYRSTPYPPLQIFDAPKGDAACVRRQKSNTPLQALVLLNEPQFVDCSRAMATRILRESPGTDDISRIQFAYRLATGRTPSSEDAAILLELVKLQRNRFVAEQIEVQQIVGMDDTLCQQHLGVSAVQALPWIVLARTLLNLDETITKE